MESFSVLWAAGDLRLGRYPARSMGYLNRRLSTEANERRRLIQPLFWGCSRVTGFPATQVGVVSGSFEVLRQLRIMIGFQSFWNLSLASVIGPRLANTKNHALEPSRCLSETNILFGSRSLQCVKLFNAEFPLATLQ